MNTHGLKQAPRALYRVNRAGDTVRDTRPRDDDGNLLTRKSSPAREQFKAGRAAARKANSPAAHAARIAAASARAASA